MTPIYPRKPSFAAAPKSYGIVQSPAHRRRPFVAIQAPVLHPYVRTVRELAGRTNVGYYDPVEK